LKFEGARVVMRGRVLKFSPVLFEGEVDIGTDLLQRRIPFAYLSL